MSLPAFTADAALERPRRPYQPQASGGRTDRATAVVAAAGETVYIPVDNVLFCCDPCMSGGPAGALLTYCCDPCASVPGMSGGPVTVRHR
jgi:hypothetical protein